MEFESAAASERVEASAASTAAAERVEAAREYELEVASLKRVAAAAMRLRLGVQRVHALIVLPPLVGISQHLLIKAPAAVLMRLK